MGSNRRYRSVPVKQVEVTKLAELGAKVIVGIDVGKHKQYACFCAADSNTQVIVRWMHPVETRDFFELCLAMRTQGQDLTMVLEPSGTYGDPFLHWLWERDFEVRRVLGRQVHAGAAAIDGVSSGHDAKSAELLVTLYKLRGSQEWKRRTEEVRNLRALVSRLRLYNLRVERLAGIAEGMLARHWPELTAIIKPSTKILWRLLAEHGGPAGVVADPLAARAFLRRHGRGFLKPAKIDCIIEAAQGTVGVPPLPAEQVWMRTIAQDYLDTAALRKVTLDEIEAAVRAHADPRLVALLGPGAVGALIGYNLDPLRFDNARAFVKALGLSLKERSSGQYQGRLRITKRGAPRARQLMVLAALRLIARDPVVKAWHLKKRARDGVRRNSANGLISAVAITRKLARAAWHVARGADFDATRLFDVSRLSVAVDTRSGPATELEELQIERPLAPPVGPVDEAPPAGPVDEAPLAGGEVHANCDLGDGAEAPAQEAEHDVTCEAREVGGAARAQDVESRTRAAGEPAQVATRPFPDRDRVRAGGGASSCPDDEVNAGRAPREAARSQAKAPPQPPTTTTTTTTTTTGTRLLRAVVTRLLRG